MFDLIVLWKNESKMIKEWVNLLLSEPEKCDEDLLKKVKAKRLELLMV